MIREIHKKYIHDNGIIKLIEDYLFVGKGIALGVEIAQREAAIIPNKLDHFIQNNGYLIERYMDDTFLLVNDLCDANELMQKYYKIADGLKIKINRNKTKITPISNYFKYCKWYYYIMNNGKIINVPDRDTIYRQRRKLRKMYKISLNALEIEISKNSVIAYLKQGNSYKYIECIRNINQ